MKIHVEESGKGELQLLKVLKTIAELEKRDEELLAILERIVEIDPSDNDARFSLAYANSNHGHRDLALLHYLRIPYQERSSMVWNNLSRIIHDRCVVLARQASSAGLTVIFRSGVEGGLRLKFRAHRAAHAARVRGLGR